VPKTTALKSKLRRTKSNNSARATTLQMAAMRHHHDDIATEIDEMFKETAPSSTKQTIFRIL
jgi:hypothetical protein